MLANNLSSVPDSRALDSHERVILRYHPAEDPEDEGKSDKVLGLLVRLAHVLVSLGAVSDSDDWKATGNARMEIT